MVSVSNIPGIQGTQAGDGPRAQRPGRAPAKTSFAALFREAEARWGLPAGLVEAVAKAESGFNPQAVSRAGALGLMQLMPATARGLGVANPLDPAQNVEGGARYLRELLDRFDGNVALALAAYNAGPGAVARYGGVPPYQETQTYVNRVLAYMQAGSQLTISPAGNWSQSPSPDKTIGSATGITAARDGAAANGTGQSADVAGATVSGAGITEASITEVTLATVMRIYAENALQKAAITIGQDPETEDDTSIASKQ